MPSQFTVGAGAGVALSNTTPANIVSANLSAGTYLVWGQVNFGMTGATLTELQAGLSLISGVMPTQVGGSGLGPDPLMIVSFALSLLTDTIALQCGPTLLTLASASQVYLVARAAFSLGSINAYGTLNALPVVGTGFNLIMS
jgi:hypothetical protein